MSGHLVMLSHVWNKCWGAVWYFVMCTRLVRRYCLSQMFYSTSFIVVITGQKYLSTLACKIMTTCQWDGNLILCMFFWQHTKRYFPVIILGPESNHLKLIENPSFVVLWKSLQCHLHPVLMNEIQVLYCHGMLNVAICILFCCAMVLCSLTTLAPGGHSTQSARLSMLRVSSTVIWLRASLTWAELRDRKSTRLNSSHL